jgi:ATP-GRASP peptide maturase of grasp-with-spasm system
MILIFSSPVDISSTKVLEWLFKFKQKVIIVNDKDSHFIDVEYLDKEKMKININGTIINVNEITAVYYRRAGKISKLESLLKNNSGPITNAKQKSLISYLVGNEITKGEILSEYLNEKRVFGTENLGRTNKYLALMAAKKIGLQTPETILTGSKEVLSQFKKKHGKIVCKSMDLGFSYSDGKQGYAAYTSILYDKYFKKMSHQFALTLFQEYIEKDFEIRCFYFNRKFYSVAYFSQSNVKTKVDYRRYDQENPNRQVPINIPNDLKRKIILLLKELNLNTGSLDIIASSGKYYFLEINPVGIFDNVSFYGNWYIEREIAEFLING